MSNGGERTRSLSLCGIFFLSGASALIFETLWFQRAGLAFGNSVWASALVLSSFMAGLALGNGLSARMGKRVREPEKLYAYAELIVGIVGMAVVAFLPQLGSALAPLFRSLAPEPVALNAIRLGLSFLLLMVPATAMGMTLPLLVKALLKGTAREGHLGVALGRLYGWNTLGAVAGALVGETILIGAMGIMGTGAVAAFLNVIAAVVALKLTRRKATQGAPHPVVVSMRNPLSRRAHGLLAASFLSGAILLALEVVWFRFLQLFLPGTTLTFSIMLSVVLLGIGLGGLIASRWFRKNANAHIHASSIALALGILALATYATFDFTLGDAPVVRMGGAESQSGLVICFFLMFPVSLLSGILYALLGHALHEEIARGGEAHPIRSTGLATMANTIGATFGPLLAGFLLIPLCGTELSLFVLAVAYTAIAALTWHTASRHFTRSASITRFLLASVVAMTAIFFPFQRIESYMQVASAKYRQDGSEVVAVREGVIETLQYLEKGFAGEPLYHRLVTNSYSMSGTHVHGKRYMKYYVYWPMAVHPEPREALLISFGTGSTARALADARELEHIDIVDISPEILEMADVVFPNGNNPLQDPRVDTHIEDGRFFLQTSDKRFDIITSEPPPLKMAGVVNLYTEEYFQLVHDRLAAGGIATYWLPVIQLSEEETKAICHAWLNVFGTEATLWSGCGLDWMLVGTRAGQARAKEGRFIEQWSEPHIRDELLKLGFEDPGQIGATFLMGSEGMFSWTNETEPLVDNYPQRLSTHLVADRDSLATYQTIMNTEATQRRFLASMYIRRVWPQSMLERSVGYFPIQGVLNEITTAGPDSMSSGSLDLGFLHHLLSETEVKTPILWAFGSGWDEQNIIERQTTRNPTVLADDTGVAYQRAIGALADRDYVLAEQLLAESAAHMLELRLYLLCISNREVEARSLVSENNKRFGTGFLDWITRTGGFDPRQEV